MNKSIRDIAIGLFVTIVGGIFVAWVIQEGERFHPSPTFDNTPTPIIITTTPGYPHISIINRLVRPAKIYINGEFANTVVEGGTSTFMVESFPAHVQFETVNFVATADSMSGTFINVYDGQTLTITNIIGDNFYFFVRINNNSPKECEIVINDGYITEKRPGILNPYAQGVSMGYYQLFSNTNVTLYCNNNQDYFWGIRPNQTQPPKSITDIIQLESGLLEVTLNP